MNALWLVAGLYYTQHNVTFVTIYMKGHTTIHGHWQVCSNIDTIQYVTDVT